jgi:8-oxo-dGTP pyrophosphatase MutT (NUDIX family)
MGASILPVTICNNKIYFLFGKERDIDENPGWSDFGGGTEKGESFLTTAIREGSEEITGFLGNTKDIKKLLSKYGTYTIDFKTEGHSTYRVHIFPMTYDNMLVYYYNNNQKFLQQKLDPKIIRDSKIFEKTEIKWFSFDDIIKNKKKFRSFYQKIVDLILQNKSEIQKFIKKFRSKTFKSIKNKTRKTRKIT